MNTVSTADTAWMLIATALVLMMTPALGFFYGGMVRAKNTLNTMMMSYVAIGFVGIAWALVGYSLAFSNGSGLTGDLRAEGQVFREYMGKLFDPALLFDIGADTASLLIPGGGLGLKVAKWTIGAAARARSQPKNRRLGESATRALPAAPEKLPSRAKAKVASLGAGSRS